MRWGRLVSSGAASLAVIGCAVVVVGIGRAASKPTDASTPRPTPTPTSRPAIPSTASTSVPRPAVSQVVTTAHPTSHTAPHSSVAPRSTVAPPSKRRAPASSTHAAPVHRAPPVSHRAPAPHRAAPTHKPAPGPVLPRGHALPLGFGTGSATRVITVVANSHGSTTATLQAWTKAPGGGWFRYGSAVTAHVGADGLSSAPSEYRSATPIGSFTLTQAFGAYSNPGTALPYVHTNSHYWWISDVHSSQYNTMQYCHPGCSFAHDPNEHLYYERPYYNYAVVIDYNTRNAPGGVHVGAGSAFFLHVTDGSATAGCVAIPQSTLVPLMRWLTPAAHPRILIGVA